MNTCGLKKPCRHCECTKGLVSPSGNMHPARVDCANCGMFHKWLNKQQAEVAKQLGMIQ